MKINIGGSLWWRTEKGRVDKPFLSVPIPSQVLFDVNLVYQLEDAVRVRVRP